MNCWPSDEVSSLAFAEPRWLAKISMVAALIFAVTALSRKLAVPVIVVCPPCVIVVAVSTLISEVIVVFIRGLAIPCWPAPSTIAGFGGATSGGLKEMSLWLHLLKLPVEE